MVQTHENLPLIAESDHIAKEASSEFNEINKEASSSESSEPIINDEKMNHKVNYMKWLKIAFYVIILLIGQTAANLLGRLYFEKGESEGSVKNKESKAKYMIGFICTIAGSAGYGLLLSLIQLFFDNVMKSESFKAIVDIIVYRSLVACVTIVVGIFVSGEWRDLKREMNEFEMGKVSYFMTLVWTTLMWKIFTVGSIALIFEVSSLFSNAVGVLGLPIVPVAAVIVFHDNMSKLKGASMALAIGGFIAYVYQQYVDDFKSKKDSKSSL
ncbi:purine permease 21-like isoform X2 [Cucumis melo]|uniref:Purine permease 21-like isoform X2 n=1 Tax=Cucumis melo TaxID=3656 RepID=A0A1S3BAR3_CUCME|nr:purine permease 21-like isoform X2 [Cucumis melo]